MHQPYSEHTLGRHSAASTPQSPALLQEPSARRSGTWQQLLKTPCAASQRKHRKVPIAGLTAIQGLGCILPVLSEVFTAQLLLKGSLGSGCGAVIESTAAV